MLPCLEHTRPRLGRGLPQVLRQPRPPLAAGSSGTPWASLRRKAWALLVFGLIVALICTRATLTAVQEEKEVVQLAQELVAREAAVGGFWPAFGLWRAICLRQTA